jgi:hypothetical protein
MLIEINYLSQFPVNIDKILDKKLKIEIENTLKTKKKRKTLSESIVFSLLVYIEILSKIYGFL